MEMGVGRGGKDNDAWQGSGWRIGWVKQWLVIQDIPYLHADKLVGTTGE